MTTKRCFRCLCEKPADEFYKHSAMADGRLGKCKDCTKLDVARHRQENLEKVRAYDRLGDSLPHRVSARRPGVTGAPIEPAKSFAEVASEIVAHDRAAKDRAALRKVTKMIGKRQCRKLRRTALNELEQSARRDQEAES